MEGADEAEESPESCEDDREIEAELGDESLPPRRTFVIAIAIFVYLFALLI